MFDNLIHFIGGKSKKTHAEHGQRSRPVLEVLEDRFTPASFEVTIGGDPFPNGTGTGAYVLVGTEMVGRGTLRWCINEANNRAGFDTITVKTQAHVDKALPTIDDDVTIKGQDWA